MPLQKPRRIAGLILTTLCFSYAFFGSAEAEPIPCNNPLAASSLAAAKANLEAREVEAIRGVYGTGTDCAWSAEQISALLATLAQAPDHGLNVSRYRIDDIEIDSDDGSRLAQRDFLASAMALRYARDMVFGQVDPAALAEDIDFPKPETDLPRELGAALAHGDVGHWLADLAPHDPSYERLKQALRQYREIAGYGGWGPTEAVGWLRVGKANPAVETLKQRLLVEGDLPALAPGSVLGGDTMKALQHFQSRHGLTPDGRLDRATAAALNVSADDRVREILINLERWRFLGHVLPGSRIEINIPAASATVIVDGRATLAMRAVVGDPRHPSPMLSSEIESIIVNPPWNVPESIIKKEIEPALERKPDYLERHRMHWTEDRLVQDPGPANSLGRIKFVFSNPFSVYLHDTPMHSLFARTDRALSHGCVRLEHPLDLAMELLKADPSWTRERIERAIARGTTAKIDVPNPMPVVLVYWTAFVDEDGTVEFRDDVYGRDARLTAALKSAPHSDTVNAASVVDGRSGGSS
jgi:murein L,D-transpeptidase YcbB/YkuD